MKAKRQVRTRHDEWGKRALSLWLKELGDVQIDARVAGESRRGDVLFTERRDRPARRRTLGTLGELARGNVLFELFRNPPTALELKSCVVKAIEMEAHEARAARRAKQPLSQVRGPMLCVILPSLSSDFADEAGAQPIAFGKSGLYTLSRIWRTVLVVVNQLPVDGSTIWLRLLGRGTVQAQAAQQLVEMSEQEPLRDATLRLLIAWQQSLLPPEHESEEDRELRMNWEQVYERWERKVKAQGRREGRAEGKAEGKAVGKAVGKAEGKAVAVLAVLEGRGLAVSAAQRKQVLACADEEQLDAWLRAVGTTPSAKALLSGGATARREAKPHRRRAPVNPA